MSTRKNFFDFFPPPAFLEMPSVGFSVSDTALRFVELHRKSDSFVLGNYAERPIPTGAVDAGYVHKPEEIVNIIKAIKQEYGLSYVKATLPEEKAFVYRTQIPLVSADELRGSVEFTLAENIPVEPADTVFDFSVIPTEQPADHIEVAVSAVPNKVIETYLALFTDAGLTVTEFELESQAIARSVIAPHDPTPHLIVNLERLKTGFYIAIGDSVQFTSTMSITAESLQELGDEISKIYWHAHGEKKEKGTVKIGKIILCGEGATRVGIKEFITAHVGIPTEVANVWLNAFSLDTYIPDITRDESLGFAAAVGLALPSRHDA